MASAADFFSEADKLALKQAIIDAERKTSGEIRVHIEQRCPKTAVDRAAEVFSRLEMHKTAERCGVLFYLAVETRVFAIYGDKGIHEKAGAQSWDGISAAMGARFREGKFMQGLTEGIAMAGELLAVHFPASSVNPNQLADEVSFE
jgi:uncharacterized membrane protein